MKHSYLLALLTIPLAACGDDGDKPKTDQQYQDEVVASMQTSISVDLGNIVTAATELQTAAPTHAWDPVADKAAIDAMKAAWKKARVGYEHVEGATAGIFGDLDVTMDARYDDYMTALAPAGDQDLFDDAGVTGMHGIERILYAPGIRTEVTTFEATLTGYKAAAFPATDAEAMSFKTKLVQKLIDDAQSLHDQWQPAAIDLSEAYRGLIGLMNEQKEKVNLAASGEEESRYANITLFDLRNNLDGTKKIYELFRPWIMFKEGAEPDGMIQGRFSALAAAYAVDPGDEIPVVPADWSNDAPTAANLATDFGVLWKTVHDEVNPTTDGSVVFEMNEIAVLLGFPEFAEEE
ncbi:MAG: EfeM/EfeO family lipoprotein [Kofleriaceae bacterium]